jgi:hypothetical protein
MSVRYSYAEKRVQWTRVRVPYGDTQDEGGILMPLLCSLGFHKYSNWTYKEEYSCEQKRRCSRCYQTDTRNEHVYGDWAYISPSDCNQVRKCKRNISHRQETRVVHIWGPATYQRDGDCERLAVCERNPEHRQETTEHIWGPPERGRNCTITRHCTRCPSGAEYLGITHEYNPTEESENGKIRRCRHCPHIEHVI